MTNYSAWDAKAEALARAAEEEDRREEEECKQALGLTEGPKGPPTEMAERQLGDLGEHSKHRTEFIEWSRGREVTLTHSAQEAPVELAGPELGGKAVRLLDSVGVTYVVPANSGIIKLMAEKCRNVTIQVLGSMLTSTVELCRCEEVDVDLSHPLGTLQVDECTSPVRVKYPDLDHVGRVYHQNSPGLVVCWGSAGESRKIGRPSASQFCTKTALGSSNPLVTTAVVRGEGEYPVDLPGHGRPTGEQPEPEAAPAAEERKRLAEQRRLAGNEMFRANDFMQAAAQYTEALQLDPSTGTVWANRAQCWLKVGNHEKALADAIKCTEVAPTNAKGWFRKGMSLHAMGRFAEAIPALLEAEKLEPANKQIPEAIKMAQLMARKHAS